MPQIWVHAELPKRAAEARSPLEHGKDEDTPWYMRTGHRFQRISLRTHDHTRPWTILRLAIDGGCEPETRTEPEQNDCFQLKSTTISNKPQELNSPNLSGLLLGQNLHPRVLWLLPVTRSANEETGAAAPAKSHDGSAVEAHVQAFPFNLTEHVATSDSTHQTTIRLVKRVDLHKNPILDPRLQLRKQLACLSTSTRFLRICCFIWRLIDNNLRCLSEPSPYPTRHSQKHKPGKYWKG